MKDHNITRPFCKACGREMVWQGDPANGPIGYECQFKGCEAAYGLSRATLAIERGEDYHHFGPDE